MIIKNYKKHNSVPIKQWSNVNYSYNKNNEKFLLYKNNYSKILNSYFNLTRKVKSFKSKRMRNLIKRFSTIKFYNSEGGVKQNSDKINFTVYTFDKEKSTQLKALHDLNKSLTEMSRYNNYRLNSINNIRNIINVKNNLSVNLIDPSFTNNKKLSYSKIINIFNISNTITKSNKLSNFYLTKINNTMFNNIYMKNINYYNKINKSKNKLFDSNKYRTIRKSANVYKRERRTILKNRRLMLQNKRNLLYSKLINNLSWSFKNKKILLYKTMYLRLFYVYVLKLLGISLTIKKQQNSVGLYCNSNIHELNNLMIDELPKKFSLIKDTDKLYKLIFDKITKRLTYKYNLSSKLSYKKLITSRNIKNIINKKILIIMSDLKLERTLWINNKLEKIMNIGLNIKVDNKDNDVNKIKKVLYKEFKKHNMNTIFNYFFEKQSMIIDNIYNSVANNDKYTYLSNILKYGLNKLYNKKVYLNMVNLKYLHMNANIFVDAIIIKLRNRKNNILKTIKRSMKLAKLGKLIDVSLEQPLSSESLNKNINFSNLINEMYDLPTDVKNMNNYTTENSVIVKDFDNKTFKNKTREILKNLRHKWITGVRLESRGRLSKRFASSRSMFKYKAKGNLRNKLGFSNEDFSKLIKKGNKVYKESPSIILSRGIRIPNIQYVKRNGVRRIGSFGIKLWMNND